MLNQWTGRATRRRLPPLRRLMIHFLGLLLLTGACPGSLFSQALSRYVKSSDAEAIINVFPAERAAYRIPRTLYGTFLEHIGQSVFGGVSAQLLDNPSLEPYPASLEFINKQFSSPAFRQS